VASDRARILFLYTIGIYRGADWRRSSVRKEKLPYITED
jgi:hypothetical protein